MSTTSIPIERTTSSPLQIAFTMACAAFWLGTAIAKITSPVQSHVYVGTLLQGLGVDDSRAAHLVVNSLTMLELLLGCLMVLRVHVLQWSAACMALCVGLLAVGLAVRFMAQVSVDCGCGLDVVLGRWTPWWGTAVLGFLLSSATWTLHRHRFPDLVESGVGDKGEFLAPVTGQTNLGTLKDGGVQ